MLPVLAAEIQSIADNLRPIFNSHRVQKALLFGSWARGTQTKNSDIDLMIVVETDQPFLKRYDEFEEIYLRFPNKEVDLLIYAPGELEAISHRKFIQTALAESAVIYER